MGKLVDKLASCPGLFIWLRRIIEAGFKGEREAIKKYLLLSADEKVLDLGCGTGEFSIFFPPAQYTGLDIEPAYIDYAKKHYRGTFEIGDATKLPYSDKSFSKIIVIGLFHHLSDPVSQEVLSEVARVLADDGRFLFIEDLASPGDPYLTKFIHRLDKGKHIRSRAAYQLLVSDFFNIEQSECIKSGLCPYQVLVLKKKV